MKLLSDHALAELKHIAREPQASQTVNPGVARKLTGERLARYVMLPSPFKTHRGKRISHLKITMLGRARLEER